MIAASRMLLRQARRTETMQQTCQLGYMKPPEAKKPKKKTPWFVGGAVVVGLGGLAMTINWSGIDDGFESSSWSDFPGRVSRRCKSNYEKLHEFTSWTNDSAPRADELLLPNTLPPPYQAPYTLLVELNDLLVWTYYSPTVGKRPKKRQGVDIFLQEVAKHYELVIFTTDSGMTAYEIIEAIDPKMCVLYKLFRDSTKYEAGVYKKDLTNLNRDLSKVIQLDVNRDVVTHAENALVLPKWCGEDDMDLIDLTDMLVVIAQDRPNDLREVIKCYTELEDPINAFRMRRQQHFDHENRKKVEDGKKKFLGKKWW